MRRDDIAIVVVPGDYGKPRPAVIVQSDLLNDSHASIIVCLLTTPQREIEGVRVVVEADAGTGIKERSFVMVDKVTGLTCEKVRTVVGRLDQTALQELNRCLMTVLDLP